MSSSTAYFMGSELQVLCGNGEEKLLLLAEGLLKKHVASHSLHEPEGTFLFPSLFLCRQPGEQLLCSHLHMISNPTSVQLSSSTFQYWSNKLNMVMLWKFLRGN